MPSPAIRRAFALIPSYPRGMRNEIVARVAADTLSAITSFARSRVSKPEAITNSRLYGQPRSALIPAKILNLNERPI